jgi:succinate dehydrogenase / fumarate reductase membrane anchor subunit
MGQPYLSTRSGSGQWLMQRVSAVLLVGMAGLHFALQHFTTDAVSTGLTVAARLNSPYWQAFYVAFILLAMYHGVNGLIGIIRDYDPPRRLRFAAETGLWVLAAFFVILGIRNVVSPVPVADVKEGYAARGFPAGASRGNPPALAVTYDYRDELRELSLMEHYLARHVARSEDTPATQIFAHDAGVDLARLPAREASARVAVCGAAFDRWLEAQIQRGPVPPEARDRGRLFSSTYEFAVWAAHVRLADAKLRSDGATAARLAAAKVPEYRANALH